MTRIFLSMAVIDSLALLTTFGTGFFESAHSQSQLHFLLGLFAVLFNLGLHCLIFIYFLGTGRWVKEIALAYSLPDVPLPRLTRDLKRATFPPALWAMLVPIAAVGTGMGTQVVGWPWPVHLGLAV